MRGRVRWLRWGVILAFLAIGMRLFQIQILDYDNYVALASATHMQKFNLPAKRGEIYMMNGDEPVAVVMNEAVFLIFVDPMRVEDEKKVEKVIDSVVSEEKRVGDWAEAWSDKSRQYYVVGRELTRAEATAIKEEGLVGVGFTETTKRAYPEGSLAAQTLGFVNNEGEGQYGVEQTFEEELTGVDGELFTVTDVNKVPLTIGDENVKVAAVDGKDIVLSLDRNIQRRVEKALVSGMERSGGTYASAVVMRPNGQILAMANAPSFDPIDYGNVEDASVYQNMVLTATYEPASVCKTFAFATGIDKGYIRPSDTYNNEGVTTVDGWKIRNVNQGHRGEITFQEALDYSLNTGSVEALRRFDSSGEITKAGQNVLYEYYHDRFGLGMKTGVELYEEQGQVISPDNEEGSAVRYANMTFGQGLSMTMMQIASAYTAIVNGGEYYTPSIIAGEMVDGKYVAKDEPEAVRRVVSEGTSATMREMLIAARNRKDTVRQDPEGYNMGAKSGTAEVADAGGGYKDDEAVATYAGFGGKELPEYVIVVRIGGEGKILDGARDAGSIWTEISNGLVGYLSI